MKKLLILSLFALCCSGIQAKSAAENFINFKQWGSKMKTDWLNFCKNSHAIKTDMMIGQTQEWFQYGIDNIKNLESLTSLKDREKYFANELARAYEIVNNHLDECYEYYTREYLAGKAKYQKQKQQLKDFAKNAGIMMNINSIDPMKSKMMKMIDTAMQDLMSDSMSEGKMMNDSMMNDESMDESMNKMMKKGRS